MGLGDVLLLNLHTPLALVAITRIPRMWYQADFEPWFPAAWLALCVLVVFWKPAVWALAAACLAAQLALGGNEGTLIIMWTAIAIGLFEGRELVTALRALTVTVYLFAAVQKLFWPFLSGAMLAGATWLPHTELVAPAVVLSEAALGVLVWRRSKWALPLAVAVHAGIVSGMNPGWDPRLTGEMVSLTGFNLLLVGLVWLTTRSVSSQIVEAGDGTL